MHHIAFDGWSINIFLKELQVYYLLCNMDAEKCADNTVLCNNIQYKDFSFWQRKALEAGYFNQQLNYWKTDLMGYKNLSIDTDKPRPKILPSLHIEKEIKIDKDTSQKLRAIAKKLNVSLYSLLLGGVYLFLRHYSNEQDIIIGTPAANRHLAQTENLIGYLVNDLPIRLNIETNLTIKDFFHEVSQNVIGAQIHSSYPAFLLPSILNLPEDSSRNPLFQVMFGMHRFNKYDINRNAKQESIVEAAYHPEINLPRISSVPVDMWININDSDECLKGSFSCAESLFYEENVEKYLNIYQTILMQLAELDIASSDTRLIIQLFPQLHKNPHS